MSLKGGYQIINLKNLEFNSEMGNSERYPDIYFNMVNSHAKMIIVSGLNMDGVKYNDYETIFYEKDDGDGMYFQAIARRIWNTRDYKCITKYINIFSDDRVTCSQDEFVYEILPDGELSLTSTNALQNKVITKNINEINDKIDVLNDKTNIVTIEVPVNIYGSTPYEPIPEDSTTSVSNGTLTYDGLGNFTCRFVVQRSSSAHVGFIDITDGIQIDYEKYNGISGYAVLSKTSDNINESTTMPMSISLNINERRGFALMGYGRAGSFDTIDLGQGNNEIIIIGKFILTESN